MEVHPWGAVASVDSPDKFARVCMRGVRVRVRVTYRSNIESVCPHRPQPLLNRMHEWRVQCECVAVHLT